MFFISMMKVIKYFKIQKCPEYMEKKIIFMIWKASTKMSVLSKLVDTFKAIPVKISPRILWNITNWF